MECYDIHKIFGFKNLETTASSSMFALSLFLLLGLAPTAIADLAESIKKTDDMVVSASSLASLAGKEMLMKGGTAIDAMIAVQTVLGLVEPQSSGIAGGAFVVYYDGEKGKLTTFDAREKATMASTGDRFAGKLA